MLSSVLTAHGGDAAALPHWRMCLGGSWSVGPRRALAVSLPSWKRMPRGRQAVGAQAGGQCLLCPSACYPKANESEQGRRGAGIMIHPTRWVLLAEILSSVAKRRAPPSLAAHVVLSRPMGCGASVGCCRHRAVTHFAAGDSGCGCLTHSHLGSSSFSSSRAFAPAQHGTGWWPSTHGPGLLLCI